MVNALGSELISFKEEFHSSFHPCCCAIPESLSSCLERIAELVSISWISRIAVCAAGNCDKTWYALELPDGRYKMGVMLTLSTS